MRMAEIKPKMGQLVPVDFIIRSYLIIVIIVCLLISLTEFLPYLIEKWGDILYYYQRDDFKRRKQKRNWGEISFWLYMLLYVIVGIIISFRYIIGEFYIVEGITLWVSISFMLMIILMLDLLFIWCINDLKERNE